jgi:hypothetical protein
MKGYVSYLVTFQTIEALCSDSEDDDSSLNNDSNDVLSDWLFLDQGDNSMNSNVFSIDETEEAADAVPSVDGILWEHDAEILQEPIGKMPFSPTIVHDRYKKLYPLLLMQCLLSSHTHFLELMAYEVNWYAKQHMEQKRSQNLLGYKLNSVSVLELLVFFALLIYYMAFFQTG